MQRESVPTTQTSAAVKRCHTIAQSMLGDDVLYNRALVTDADAPLMETKKLENIFSTQAVNETKKNVLKSQ